MTGPWRKSSRSGAGTDSQCVEARAPRPGVFQVRDSKLANAPILDVPTSEFAALLADFKAGRFDA